MLSPKVIDYFNYENLELCIRAELLLPSLTIPDFEKSFIRTNLSEFFWLWFSLYLARLSHVVGIGY